MFGGTNGGHIISERVRVGIWQGKNEGRERMGPEIVGTWQEREFSWVNEKGGICVLQNFREEILAIWQELEFGWADKKGRIWFHMDEGRNRRYMERERESEFGWVYYMGDSLVS